MKLRKHETIEYAANAEVSANPGISHADLIAAIAQKSGASHGYTNMVINRMAFDRIGSGRKIRIYPKAERKLSWFEWLLRKVGV